MDILAKLTKFDD